MIFQTCRLLISRFRVRDPGGSLKSPHICRTCQVELTPDNWPLRCSTRSHYICRECSNSQRRLRYRNIREAAGFHVEPHKIGIPTCQCGAVLTTNNWYEVYRQSNRYICKACESLNRKEANRQLRLEVIRAYGSKCVRCGIDNPWLLDVDHINNDGHEDKKQGRVKLTLYYWLRKNGYPKDNYQLLCKNCNWLKYLISIGTIPNNCSPSRQNSLENIRIYAVESSKKLTQGGKNENAGGGC